tara:strand:- start:63 stop:1535 length:1473 start_codon:yes stop_codon:yes gene_type:complete
MRLIGGTISDTPVKEIGDGSAFNVGGSAAIPKFLSVTSTTSKTALSGFDVIDPTPFNASATYYACGMTYVEKITDDLFVMVWRSNADGETKASVITFSSGVATFGAEQNLTALSQGTAGSSGQVLCQAVGTDKVLVANSRPSDGAASDIQTQLYDVNGGSTRTLTATSGSSRQTISMAHGGANNVYSHSVMGFGMIVLDANRAIILVQHYHYPYPDGTAVNGKTKYFPFRFTATQSVGSIVAPQWGNSGYTGHQSTWRHPTEDAFFQHSASGAGVIKISWSSADIAVLSLAETHYGGGPNTASGTPYIFYPGNNTSGLNHQQIPKGTAADEPGAVIQDSYLGLHWWTGEDTSLASRTEGPPQRAYINIEEGASPAPPLAGHMATWTFPDGQAENRRIIVQDQVGDWQRLMWITCNSTDAFYFTPLLLNWVSGKLLVGQITKHTTNGCNGTSCFVGFIRGQETDTSWTFITQDSSTSWAYNKIVLDDTEYN